MKRRGIFKPLQLIVSGLDEQLVCFERSCSRMAQLKLTPAYLEQIERDRPKLVARVPWDTNLEVATLLQYADRVPELFEHFTNIQFLTDRLPVQFEVGDEAFQSHLIELLKRSNTKGLKNSTMNLTQHFYDQLACVESIKYLTIDNCDIEHFDFNCFLNLKALTRLFICFKTISI